MKQVKMTLTFAQDAVDELRAVAVSEGFVSPQMLARHLIVSGVRRMKQKRQGIDEYLDLVLEKAREGIGNGNETK
jgi:hypothetical protein